MSSIQQFCQDYLLKFALMGDYGMAKDLQYHSRVRMYCMQSVLRQEDLAREVDVSRRTIITTENDNCNLSLATALRLAAYFQRTVNELFMRDKG